MIKNYLSQSEQKGFTYVEWRVSIYGTSLDEWKKLAAWIKKWDLYSPRPRWII